MKATVCTQREATAWFPSSSVARRRVAVRGPDGKPGIWPLDGGGFHAIPGLESKQFIIGWSPDGESLYVTANQRNAKSRAVSRINLQSGKLEPWKNFGQESSGGSTTIGPPHLSSDGTAYAYVYNRLLSEAYVVSGLR